MSTQHTCRLALERGRHGWTKAYVAAYVGVNRSTVGRWESGQTVPTPEHLVKLADLFNVPADRLFP